MPAEAPFALVTMRRGAMRLMALSPATAQSGSGAGSGARLHVGMTLAAARARLPDLAVLPHDPAGDAAWLHRLARACTRYTPFAAPWPPPPEPPGALMLDITGCAHLFGGEAALVARVVADLAAEGLTANPALANTPEGAHALARFGVAALHDLPITALAGVRGGEGDCVEALTRAGLHDVGAVAALPRAALAARFGAGVVRRLARLLGEEEAPLSPLTWARPVAATRRFAEPIARSEDVLCALEALAREVVAELAQRGMGGRAFTLALARCDGHIARLTVECAVPTRDVPLITRLFAERIDSLADPLDPGFGFDAIALAVPRAEVLPDRQVGLPSGAAAGGSLSGEKPGAPQSGMPRPGKQGPPSASTHPTLTPLLDRLAVRHGPQRVLRFAAGNSHSPEREATLVPLAGAAPAAAWPAPQPQEPPTRPLLLFDPPQPVEVLTGLGPGLEDAAPRRFYWRGRAWTVARAEGPERIAPEWWRRKGGHLGGSANASALTRDYYRVEDDAGHRFWLFRLPPSPARPGIGPGIEPDTNPQAQRPMGRWYLHGLFA